MSLFDYSEFKEKVESYEKIIILAHEEPDYDAMGSQLGLYLSLKGTYPNKDIKAGSTWKDEQYKHHYSILTPEDYKGALVIFTDTPAPSMVGDPNYTHGDYVIVIDHHFSRGKFGDLSFIDNTVISACLIVYDIIETLGLYINQEAAKLLLSGILTDSGRFRYKNTDKETFRIASALMDVGVDLQSIYSEIYKQSLAFVRHQGYVMSHFKVHEEKIAYIIHTKELIEQSQLSFFEVTRGMVNTMADIEGIDAWANFTVLDEGIKAEFRSKKIPVVSVARAFGGGGHELACGATLNSFDQIEDCLKELDKTIQAAQS